MSIKLRDLIRNVRACKTAAEERAVIAKESALIRTSFKNQDGQYRHRNIAKLLFIHMLGYPSYFGQMECLKLIASPYFPEKKMGYLGLTLLLNDQEDVLTLVTNSIKNDLNHSNPFVSGLALAAVGNLASADMARDLTVDIEKHLKTNNDYLRKKAALAAIRVFKKVPDLIEDFVEPIQNLIKSRNHAVKYTGVQLIIDILDIDPEEHQPAFQHLVSPLVKQLRNLIAMGYVPEYDVSGIADPFLQVKILQLLRRLGKHHEDASEAMNDVLAQVATNTETAKNAGNAILYECVQTIMSIESESGLRVLAVNILGRFLLNRDNNIRYVALNTLSKVVADDVAAVQRHRNTIVECLKDPDVSIRQRALELIYALVNETNIRSLARELLNYLVVASVEKKPMLCRRIAEAVDRYAPSRQWHIDTMITMLSISGGSSGSSGGPRSSSSISSSDEDLFEDNRLSSSLIALIQQNPPLHAYVVHKLYWALSEDISQLGLVHVGVWCIGEYAQELMLPLTTTTASLVEDEEEAFDDEQTANNTNNNAPSSPVEEQDILDLLIKIIQLGDSTEHTKGLVLTSVIKLSCHASSLSSKTKIQRLLKKYQSSMVLELQQRACEYMNLLEDEARHDVLMKMPAIEKSLVSRAQQAIFSDDENDDDDNDNESEDLLFSGSVTKSVKASGASSSSSISKKDNLLDLDDIFGGGATTTSSTSSIGIPAITSTSDVDLLSDIFSATPAAPLPAPAGLASVLSSGGPSSSSTATEDLMSLMDLGSGGTSPPVSIFPTLQGYNQNGLKIMLELSKPNPLDPSVSHLLATFENSNSSAITNVLFQAAFPKFITLRMDPPSGNVVPAFQSGTITQLITITNSMHGQKPVAMRMKLQYSLNNEQKSVMETVSGFPPNF